MTEVDRDAEGLDLPAQEPSARVVELSLHQPAAELDDVGLQAEIEERLRGFEPEESAADDGRAPARRRPTADRAEIVDGAVDEDAGEIAARDRRDDGREPVARTRRS